MKEKSKEDAKKNVDPPDELALDYERNKAAAAVPWDHARHAVQAAWAKVSHDIGPRDPDWGDPQRILGAKNQRASAR
jgi:hypothetical protein